MQSLDMHQGLRRFLYTAWKYPQKLCDAFSEFCKSALYSKPTKAHYALTQIALEKGCAIITENVDLLHQQTCIKPLDSESAFLRTLSATQLQDIDVIICIGLSHDDRGLLAWYKKNNPAGVIIAIDLKQPNYLTHNDYYCQRDIQELIPQLLTGLTA
jgi:NAD-dependent SIR2 family protein deacetylase